MGHHADKVGKGLVGPLPGNSATLQGGKAMLAARGYRTKKDLRGAIGQTFHFTETSAFGSEYRATGENTVVGPSAYERKWYATVKCEQGIIKSVK